ncbi:hypothetical protein C8J57DRAFT_1252420 [Mycena rebaudengoi]|nr:hypothetical protein C8J57DRAFT_1252420 [Mycena rebaudengoi]
MGIATVDTARDIATVLTLSTGRQPGRSRHGCLSSSMRQSSKPRFKAPREISGFSNHNSETACGIHFLGCGDPKSGDAVFLGLTALTEYRRDYELEDLKKVAHRQGYEIFMDEWFTLHAIDAGYEHESVVKNIHELLINFHRTFVLVKRDRSEHASVKEQISAQGKELEAQLEGVGAPLVGSPRERGRTFTHR